MKTRRYGERQVSSAQLSLTQAKTAAAEAQVTAPMSGTLTAVNVANGDQLGDGTSTGSSGSSAASSSASSSQAALVITDTTHVEAVVSLAETDVPMSRWARRLRSPLKRFLTSRSQEE